MVLPQGSQSSVAQYQSLISSASLEKTYEHDAIFLSPVITCSPTINCLTWVVFDFLFKNSLIACQLSLLLFAFLSFFLNKLTNKYDEYG